MPESMLLASIKAAMQEISPGEKDRCKQNAVARWLLHVACNEGLEKLFDDVVQMAEVIKFIS